MKIWYQGIVKLLWKITGGPARDKYLQAMLKEIILMKIFSCYDLDEYEIEDGDTTGGDRKSNIYPCKPPCKPLYTLVNPLVNPCTPL